ncbi:DNA adenine methylase [Antarcticirhabdus aurantiaca]|uniref:DNA adenine methylase n=1 Tax=Antarcticirhabdus aurantiaca TaxID=2606717 RepID=UPI00131C2FC1|nr:DNA adenine methylase [Antarcticirhabdus aurantiaca]
MSQPTRPALRWFGGKWRLAPWIIEHLPPHRTYVEPFGGAASVLLRKERSYAEVYNDLDDDAVCLFRILRDRKQAAELERLLYLTPFALSEFRAAYKHTDDPLERSRRLLVRSFMGFGANSATTFERGANTTGFRRSSSRSGTTPAHDWRNYPEALGAIVDRLRGVTIEHRDAREVMAYNDRPDTLHYVDPPYVHATRSLRNPYCKKSRYRHELSDADHAELLAFLTHLTGMVVLSGNATALYDEALAGWKRVQTVAMADQQRRRLEVLWINPAAVADLNLYRSRGLLPLFGSEVAA